MTRGERTEAQNDFAKLDDVEVFVVSIAVGGVGLNLTCADTVFILVCITLTICFNRFRTEIETNRMRIGIRPWCNRWLIDCIVWDRKRR